MVNYRAFRSLHVPSTTLDGTNTQSTVHGPTLGVQRGGVFSVSSIPSVPVLPRIASGYSGTRLEYDGDRETISSPKSMWNKTISDWSWNSKSILNRSQI